MLKARISAVSLLAGFFATYAVGGLHNAPSTFVGRVVLAIGCYFVGAIFLVVAAVVLTLAGFKVRWPLRSPTEQRDRELMQRTLSPARRYLWWVVMMGGLIIGPSIPFIVWYFAGGVWAFVAFIPALAVLGAGIVLSDRVWKPFRDAQRALQAIEH